MSLYPTGIPSTISTTSQTITSVICAIGLYVRDLINSTAQVYSLVKQLYYTNTPRSERRSALMARHISDEGQLPRILKPKKSNILWSGTAWTSAKQLTHYPSFSRHGITINVKSFAIIRTKEDSHYLGYLKDIYEDRKGEKKVRVQLFRHFQEVQRVIPQLGGHPREVLSTPHAQVRYADCIDAPATVLTPGDYEKYISLVPKDLSSSVYMCSREFRNKKAMPFSLWELDGYYNQSILTVARSQDAQLKSKGHMLHEVEDITPVDPSTQGPRGSRSIDESGYSGIRKSIPGNQISKVKPPTCPKLKEKIPSRGQAGFQLVEPKHKMSFEAGDTIEVLCQDSGMRGCWFRCKVLQVSQKRLKVQYDDILDCDGPVKLEEWIPSSGVAGPDKLGMRWTGRLTVRPRPLEDSADYSIEVGAAPDAWWSDGWWEGVVVEYDVFGSGHLHVYFPGENRILEIQRENVRISRDWIDNKWVEVKGKKGIRSFVSSSLTDASMCSIKEPGKCENLTAPMLVTPEHYKMASTSKHSAEKKKGRA